MAKFEFWRAAENRAVCGIKRLNEHFLLRCEWTVHSGQTSSACRSLTCLRKKLKLLTRGHPAGCRALSLQNLRKGTDAEHGSFLFFFTLHHNPRPWPGCQDTVMWRAMYHVITELPVYLRLGDRRDLRKRWLGSGERCERARHERTILNLTSWDPDYSSLRTSCQTPVADGGWAVIMNGLAISIKYSCLDVARDPCCATFKKVPLSHFLL